MAAALSGLPDGAHFGALRLARTAVRRGLRRRTLVPDRAQVLRVAVTYRVCPCGGWVAAITADGMAPRSVHAADADELNHAVQYEFDVLMSETGRVLAPEHALAGEPPRIPIPARRYEWGPRG